MICLFVGNSPAHGGVGIDADTIPPPNSPVTSGSSPLTTAAINGVHDDVNYIGTNIGIAGIDLYVVRKGVEGVGHLGAGVDQVAIGAAIVKSTNAKTSAETNEASSDLLAAAFGSIGSLAAAGLTVGLLPEVASLGVALALAAVLQVAISAASHAAAHAIVNAGAPASSK